MLREQKFSYSVTFEPCPLANPGYDLAVKIIAKLYPRCDFTESSQTFPGYDLATKSCGYV